MSQNSKYTYCDLDPDKIRLLKLKAPDLRIECELHVFQRANAPYYYALSYCWGSDVPSHAVLCDGRDLLVTKNLVDGLHQLSQPRWNPEDAPAWFWADEICINQADDKENSVHVKAMGETYSNASCVLLWLGAAENGSDLAMDRLPAIVDCMLGTKKTPGSSKTLQNRMPEGCDSVWDAILTIFNRPYFRRGWVMQEIILARKIEVLCGDKMISWEVMSEFATDRFNTIPSFLLVKDSAYKRRNSRTGRGSCALLEVARNNTTGGHRSAGSIAALLWIGAEKGFTDHRDRAFALVGLMPPDMRDRIIVDYGADDTESVISLGRLMLERLPNLFTLSLKRPTSFQKLCHHGVRISTRSLQIRIRCHTFSDSAQALAAQIATILRLV